MSTRDTPVLQTIVDVLFTEVNEQTTALHRLEHHFAHRLLVVSPRYDLTTDKPVAAFHGASGTVDASYMATSE